MIVKYDDELKKQTFLENALTLLNLGVLEKANPNDFFTLGIIEDPIVALDHNALEQMDNGKLISHLFGHSEIPLTTFYDGLTNDWHSFENTWPPAIDSLVHLNGQRNTKCLEDAEKILDVACGTGVAGTYALHKNHNIKEIHFSDIEPNALKSVDFNITKYIKSHFNGNPSKFARKVFYNVGDGLKEIKDKYDVIVASAIPATPSFPGIKRPLNPLFEGTQLLEDLLRDAPERLNKGGKLILSHSNLGDKAFAEFADKYGAKVDRELCKRQNGFRVEFLGDQDWVDYLVENHGMEEIDHKGFQYWHISRVKEISFD